MGFGNGVDGWQINGKPSLPADPQKYPEELWAIEDPSLTFVPEFQKYAVDFPRLPEDAEGLGARAAIANNLKTGFGL